MYNAKLYFDGPEEIGKDDYFAVPLSKIRPRVVVDRGPVSDLPSAAEERKAHLDDQS